MTYVRRDSLESPFGVTPASYHRDDARLRHEYEPYVRFACGKTQFDVSFSIIDTAETITRLFEDLDIAKFDDDDECSLEEESDDEERMGGEEKEKETKDEKTQQEQEQDEKVKDPSRKPVVLNDEPIEIPFDADVFHILLRCQNDPGLEEAHLHGHSFGTLVTLLQLADYLNMPDRIEFFARSMSEMLEDETPERCGQIMGVKQDLSERELARMRGAPIFRMVQCPPQRSERHHEF